MRPSRAVLPLLPLLVVGCSAFRELFPSHEDVFKPIPVSLGEEHVTGADTTYTLAGPGYELVSRTREPLPEAKTALDGAAASFRRYFSQDPPAVVVTLRVRQRRAERGDSAQRADTASLAPADSRPRVTVFVAPPADPRDPRAGRMMMAGVSSTAIATPVVRAWMEARADRVAPRADSAVARAGMGPGDDPRIPDWLEATLPERIAGSPRADMLAMRFAAQAADKRATLLPLRTLFTTPRPGSDRMRQGRADEDSAAVRGGERDERGERRPGRQGARGELLAGPPLFDAEAASVLEFLVTREGMPFVGQLTDILLAGGSVEDALRGATRRPRTIDDLDAAWRSWLETQRPDQRR